MTAPRRSCARTSASSGAPAIASSTPRRWPRRTTTASRCGSARPRRAKTKGKVESDVPYVRERLLRGHCFADYEQANRDWRELERGVARQRVHGTHGEVVAARAERDRAALGPLPAIPYLVVARTQRKVARDGLFSFEGRRYMVGGAMIGETVELRLGAAEIEVYSTQTGERYCRHARQRHGAALPDPERALGQPRQRARRDARGRSPSPTARRLRGGGPWLRC